MNLALIDPFRRQVPDRIDSTLGRLPTDLHPPLPTNEVPLVLERRLPSAAASVANASESASADGADVEMADASAGVTTAAAATAAVPRQRQNWSLPDPQDWISCHAVAFNRRGTYLAAGHHSGAVPVHDVLGRTLSAVHRPPAFGEGSESPPLTEDEVKGLLPPPVENMGVLDMLKMQSDPQPSTNHVEEQFEYRNGVTSLSWSRRSRLLLVAAVGDRNVRLIDNAHPLGVNNAVLGTARAAKAAAAAASGGSGGTDGRSPVSVTKSYEEDDDGEDGVGIGGGRGTPKKAAKRRKKSVDAAARGSPSPLKIRGDLPKNVTMESYRILPPAKVVSVEVSTSSVEEVEKHCQRYGLDDTLGGGDGTFAACRRAAAVAAVAATSVAVSEQMRSGSQSNITTTRPYRRYQTQILPLPNTVGASVQLHPRDCHAGLAVLSDGSLVMFRFPIGGFVESEGDSQAWKRGRVVYIVKPGSRYFVTDAVFGSGGELYAGTKCGTLLGFTLGEDVWRALCSPLALDLDAEAKRNKRIGYGESLTLRTGEPAFRIKISGGAAAWQLVVSRNGRLILINSADCALRLFGADECWESAKVGAVGDAEVKPRFVFQDLVSKIAWTSCDFSGDGEYVVGGCNSNPHQGDRYDLYLWNTGTGALMDQLTGPQVELHDVSFHPTRPFVAVATSDGIVDVWGPRMDWTAFAPDFQALPMNIEYIEKEDEFDVVVDGDNADGDGRQKDAEAKQRDEGNVVDVKTIDSVPVFDSDSEDEEDVFTFDTKIVGIMKKPGPTSAPRDNA